MTFDANFPKRKRGRPPTKETVAERIFQAHQEKLRQAEIDEPLSDFDLAAIAERLRRRK